LSSAHLSAIGNEKKPQVAVDCFSLNAILDALNVSHVDYLSLDVEGPELEILRTVDWTRLRIDVITVEYTAFPANDWSGKFKKLKDLRQFFRETGIYWEVSLLPVGLSDVYAVDVAFSHI